MHLCAQGGGLLLRTSDAAAPEEDMYYTSSDMSTEQVGITWITRSIFFKQRESAAALKKGKKIRNDLHTFSERFQASAVRADVELVKAV